jgi:hypothetical protein
MFSAPVPGSLRLAAQLSHPMRPRAYLTVNGNLCGDIELGSGTVSNALHGSHGLSDEWNLIVRDTP